MDYFQQTHKYNSIYLKEIQGLTLWQLFEIKIALKLVFTCLMGRNDLMGRNESTLIHLRRGRGGS